MKWKWADFWGFLMPEKKARRQEEEPAASPTGPSQWRGTFAGKILMVAAMVVLFGGLAAWIIVRVVAFFGGF